MRTYNHPRIRVAVIALLLTAYFPPSAVYARNTADRHRPEPLRVGTVAAPPFAMERQDGGWEGIGVDLWKAAAAVLGAGYEMRCFGSMRELLDAVHSGMLDVAVALIATEERETLFDLSHAYFRSGLAIAVPVENTGGWAGVTDLLSITRIIGAVAGLILLWCAAGAALWMFERRRHSDMFGRRFFKGIGDGVWWAAVTMTTVGYGDKAPRTFGGRTVAIVWMFASIFLVSSFTASIAAVLTAERLSGKVRDQHDLHHVGVGAIVQTEAAKWLTERGIAPVPFADVAEGLQAVADDQIDAFVIDELILRHAVKTGFPGRIQVLPGTFEHYFVCMAMPDGSPLREPVNRALLKAMKEEKWNRVISRHIGIDI